MAVLQGQLHAIAGSRHEGPEGFRRQQLGDPGRDGGAMSGSGLQGRADPFGHAACVVQPRPGSTRSTSSPLQRIGRSDSRMALSSVAPDHCRRPRATGRRSLAGAAGRETLNSTTLTWRCSRRARASSRAAANSPLSRSSSGSPILGPVSALARLNGGRRSRRPRRCGGQTVGSSVGGTLAALRRRRPRHLLLGLPKRHRPAERLQRVHVDDRSARAA